MEFMASFSHFKYVLIIFIILLLCGVCCLTLDYSTNSIKDYRSERTDLKLVIVFFQIYVLAFNLPLLGYSLRVYISFQMWCFTQFELGVCFKTFLYYFTHFLFPLNIHPTSSAEVFRYRGQAVVLGHSLF